MSFLLDKCTLKVFNNSLLDFCLPFDCGNDDLNEFFAKDIINYSAQLLGKSYCFTLDDDPRIIICAFTISNDSIKTINLPNGRKKKLTKVIPRDKQMRSYPAVLIGRLGVNKFYRKDLVGNQRVAYQLMDFIKSWFVDEKNKTGCRFIVVDAYNESYVINYYEKNGFLMLFGSETQEKEYYELDAHDLLSTRLMYFDLILLQSTSKLSEN